MKKLLLCIISVLLIFACTTTPGTGRKRILLTSESQENKMGEDYYKEFLSKVEVTDDEHYKILVKRVGERLAAAARKKYNWEYTVVEDDQINAWALPGGKICFYTGIMKIFDMEAEIAVVMGHEIAHVILRHGGERMTQGQIVNVLGSAIAALTEQQKSQELFLGAYSGLSTVGVLLPFSRLHEYEADKTGTELMAKAGYDPMVAVGFWEKMAKLSRSSKKTPEFLSTHPADNKRVAKLKEILPGMYQYYNKATEKYEYGEKVNK
ncbi:M48 family metallopeptidase [Spirochaetota bacterium]